MRDMRNKILKMALIGLLLFSVSQEQAFALGLYDSEIRDNEAISKLSDAMLLETYVEVVIDLEASKTFNETSGFNAKEFGQFKKLLRYKIYLAWEIEKRGLKIPGLGL